MTSNASVILLEFNELCPSLMDRFMSAKALPNFQRFFDESVVYITDAEEHPPCLNPWIQWVTVHSGMPFAEHQIYHLDEGHKLTKKCVWDILSDADLRVWICGSMNIRYDTPINGLVLPDPWTTAVRPYPQELLRYFRFIQKNVQEHTNEQSFIQPTEYLGFLGFMVAHGLSVTTVHSIVRQLMQERMGKSRWKRAVLLDNLQWDVFHWYHRKINPHFSTFFVNSTAHLQHKYWRYMDAQHFKLRPTDEERAKYGRAVLFGYQQMDNIVSRALKLADEKTTLIFCTALSQQPCLTYEDEGGKCFYRPREFERLLAFIGISIPHTVSPVMSEQFHVLLESQQDAREAEHRLSGLAVDGIPAMLVERRGNAVFTGCRIFSQLPEASVLSSDGNGRTAKFFELFYQAEGIKSGMHHPDGLLWIRHPNRQHRVHDGKVSLCRIAPTILDIFDVPMPEYMRGKALA